LLYETCGNAGYRKSSHTNAQMQRMVSEKSMILANGCRLAGLAFTFSLGVLLQLLVNPGALSLHSMLHLQPISNVRVV